MATRVKSYKYFFFFFGIYNCRAKMKGGVKCSKCVTAMFECPHVYVCACVRVRVFVFSGANAIFTVYG